MSHPVVASDTVARIEAIRRLLPQVEISVRSCSRSLMGLRRNASGALVLRIDPELLLDPDYPVSVSEWILRRGRGGVGTVLQHCLSRVETRRSERAAASAFKRLADMPIIGPVADLHALTRDIHAGWFSDLPNAVVRWGRNPPRRRLRHIRFGCYRRATGQIDISPRLARPWIATSFLLHVIHHELCHHRQAMRPVIRREGVHSPRFRDWERQFPGYVEAITWERLALPWLLDDACPPWYHPLTESP